MFHVVLCSHQGAKFIAEQLDSIIRQSDPIDFIHVYDFASSDATRSIVEKMAYYSAVPTIRLIQHTDAPGASVSFFRAFADLLPQLQDEDFIYFCDQDDVWLPNKSAVIKSEIREFNSCGAGDAQLLICHDVQVVDEGLSVQRESYYSGNPFMMPRDLARDRLVLSNPIIGHTICVSTQLLRSAVNFLRPSQYMMHDWAIVLLASRLGTIKFVPKTLSLYRQHANNILGAYGRRSWREVAHRTFLFSFGVVRQSNIFFSDLSAARKISPDLVPRLILFDRCLVRIAQHFSSGNFLFLAGCAFLRGPTLQRRLLSGVLMVAGFWKILGLPEPTMKRKKR